MTDWKLIKLSDLSNKKDAIVSGPFGSNLKVSDYKSEGVPILRLQNIGDGYFINKDIKFISEEKANELKYHSFQSGDIALAKLGIPIGKTCIIPESFPHGIIVADVVRIRPDRQIVDYKFLEYYLNSDLSVKQLTGNISGATRPRVNLSDVRNIELSLPPLLEQKQIVSILDRAFAAIDQAKANLERNIENAKELFQSKLNEIFSQTGDGWEEKSFKDVCVLQRGFDLPTRLRKKGQYALVSSSGISDTHVESKVNGPGVVTGRSGSIGNVFFINDPFWPLNTTLYIKDFNGNHEKYIYYFLRFFDLSRYSSGSGVPTLNRNFVHDVKVNSTADIEEQVAICSLLDSLESKVNILIGQYDKRIVHLEELKKSILQQAFSGELTKGSASGLTGLEDEQDLGVAAEPQESYNEKSVTRS